MTEPKDNESFFRKVVRFVANPTTEWADLNTRQEAGGELDLEKSELKAMVERKRRNDFVRKREFDMLRKIRREGLTPEQLAALGTSSRMDDSEPRISEVPQRSGGGVKDKIDNIEREMVGDGVFRSTVRPPGFFDAPTEPAAPFVRSRGAPLAAPTPRSGAAAADDSDRLPTLPPLPDMEAGPEAVQPPPPPPAAPAQGPLTAPATPAPPPASPPPPARAVPLRLGPGALDVEVEVSEIAADPDLDEAVIAFANADFVLCEKSLRRLITGAGERAQHADTWLALFDLYRATGQHERFESLALDFVQQTNSSPPQWFSLPKIVADAVAEERPTPSRVATGVGWTCPETLDIDAVARLRSQTLQMPLPWVFDWSELRLIDAEAATQLSALFRNWAGQMLEMQWIEGEHLFSVLAESAPTGVRDADPAFWLTRMDALRLAGRVNEFDETAIDYCVTYEVSPPSWEPTRCKVRITGAGALTRAPALSVISEVSTSFMESWGLDEAGSVVQVATVDLTGQLVGDINILLQRMNSQIGTAPVITVSCARLIRVDFIAAGDLLNWVLAKRTENRTVQFTEAHRLVALFLGAMGINEHARILVRKI